MTAARINKGQAALNRRLAQQAGQPVYQGAACPEGHDSPRYVSTRACVACAKAARHAQSAAARSAKESGNVA